MALVKLLPQLRPLDQALAEMQFLVGPDNKREEPTWLQSRGITRIAKAVGIATWHHLVCTPRLRSRARNQR